MNTLDGQKRHYLSFLLRLSETTSAGVAIWRVSLEEPRTGKQYSFADLNSLFTFLEEQVKANTSEPPPSTSGRGSR